MKIKGLKIAESIEVEIDKQTQLNIVEDVLLKIIELDPDGDYFLQSENILEQVLIDVGSHSYYRSNFIRKASEEDKIILKCIEKIKKEKQLEKIKCK